MIIFKIRYEDFDVITEVEDLTVKDRVPNNKQYDTITVISTLKE